MINPEILQKIKLAPRFSEAALKLIRLVGSGDYSAKDIIATVKYDPRLTALLLKLVNSAGFGLSRQIDSIHTAVVMLGARRIMAIVLEIYAKMYLDQPLAGYESSGLWQHSLRTALAAGQLAALVTPPQNREGAFTAGILHDLGKLILSDSLGDTSHHFVHAIDKKRLPDYLAAEQEELGTDHGEVGEMLARFWQLPEFLCQTMAYHHHPGQAPEEYRPICYAIHLADIIAMLSYSDQGADALLYHLDPDYTAYLTLSVEQLSRIIFEVDREMVVIRSSMNDVGL
ncbi:MAG: HDOD domain-containing protein [Victivallales bacterium]|nr:HDOD domain-containing protein [Victivallales bacterium]